jgi:hypothetical protein
VPEAAAAEPAQQLQAMIAHVCNFSCTILVCSNPFFFACLVITFFYLLNLELCSRGEFRWRSTRRNILYLWQG